MSTRWALSDGTTVETEDSGATVEGTSPAARQLQSDLRWVQLGAPPQVELLPPPGGWVPLETGNRWLVDRWVRSVAARFDLEVTTAYAPSLEEAPEEARDLLGSQWEADEGVVY